MRNVLSVYGFLCAGAAFLLPASSSFAAPVSALQGAVYGHALDKAAPRLINASNAALDDAQKFVAQVADEGIGFLSDQSLSQDQRKDAFKKLLQRNFDMRTIARFSLGRHWRTATKAQQEEYMALFEKMILNVYARRFSDYEGQKLLVRDARPEGENDILVHSAIEGKNGGEPVKVDWRLRKKNGVFKVIDVLVEGVSMSVTQRSDFASVIQRGGGDIEVLLAHLRGQK